MWAPLLLCWLGSNELLRLNCSALLLTGNWKEHYLRLVQWSFFCHYVWSVKDVIFFASAYWGGWPAIVIIGSTCADMHCVCTGCVLTMARACRWSRYLTKFLPWGGFELQFLTAVCLSVDRPTCQPLDCRYHQQENKGAGVCLGMVTGISWDAMS